MILIKQASSYSDEEKQILGIYGIPNDWPVEEKESNGEIPSGFIEVTQQELEAIKSTNQSAYDAWSSDHVDVVRIPDVSPRQIRQALLIQGITEQIIQDAFATLQSPQKEFAQIAWEYSINFVRTDPLVESVGVTLGWTSEQIDALWNYAFTL